MPRMHSFASVALALIALIFGPSTTLAAETGAPEPAETATSTEGEADAFPGREVYFYVDVLELEELQELHARDAAHIIDVRTRYEYDTLRVEGAEHVNLDDPDFVAKVRELHARDPGLPVVFYCRGHTCFMGYQAAEKMLSAGFEDVFNMDAGIFDWAQAYPEDTAMFGEAPIERADLIDFNKFRKHLLPPREFAEIAHQDEAHVLDIRRPFERDQIGLFLGNETNIPAADRERLEPFLDEVRDSSDPLLVYDITGHEIKAFQYTLEQQGISDYYFMEGGFKAFQEQLLR